MEKKIRPAKELYENLVRDSSDIIISVDLDRKVIVFNPAAEKAFGYTKEEIIGKHVNMLYADPSQGLHVHKATKEISTFEGEIVNRRKDGSTFISQLSTGVLHNEDGNVIGVMGISRDITKKKLEEDELAKLLQKSLLHVQQAPLAVIEWNTNFEVTEWNPAAEKIFGYRKEEALGHHAEFIIHEAAKEHVDVVWQSLLSQQGGMRSTNENITKDGNILFCEWYNTPLVSESGEVLGVASLAHDITEVKLADEKLKLLNETLEQRVAERTVELKEKNIVLKKEIAEREKMEEALLQSEKLKSIGTITAGVSHEFNNILSIISGKVQLLEMDYNDNSELMGEFSTIMKAVDDGAAITDNMLKITKSSDSTSAFVLSDLNEL
ncbi:MAG: PAS domain S-box protein, partial [Candidatus Scalindua sp.]|nr:PAS domain S-box protein [Candidatus Scalindua sp.]